MAFNPLLVGISPNIDINEKRKLVFVNLLTTLSVIINIAYFIYLFSINEIILSMMNLCCVLIFGIVGFYLMKTKKYQIAKVINFISIPIVLTIFTFIYGNIGFNLYFILISILSFFIINNKRTIYLLNIWIFTVFCFINIGAYTQILKPLNMDIAYLSNIFTWTNLIFGFICNVYVLSVFRNENLSYELSIIQKNNQILKTNEELKRLNSEKNTFISALSHDLKNPFNSILGFLHILKTDVKTNDIEITETYINIVNNKAIYTYNLLEDLLMWGKLQRDGLSQELQKLNLLNIYEEIIDSLKFNADDKNILISHIIPEDIEVITDINILKTILRNLISNAIKFSHNSSQITVNAYEQDSKIIVQISDVGIGISNELLQTLFETTKSCSTKGTNNEIGSGIGLYLCKECIDKLEEKIWIDSEINKGTKVYFSLQKA